jgi:hypothetical protein
MDRSFKIGLSLNAIHQTGICFHKQNKHSFNFKLRESEVILKDQNVICSNIKKVKVLKSNLVILSVIKSLSYVIQFW